MNRGHFRILLRTIMLCGVIVAAGAELMSAPVPERRIVGHSEYERTGKYPTRLVLSGNTGARVAIPTPDKSFPVFQVESEASAGPPIAVLTLWYGENCPASSSIYEPTGYQWRLRDGDVIPILGHVYLARVSRDNSITLTRVTEKLDEKLRPKTETRLIAMNSVHARMFWEKKSGSPFPYEYDWIEVDVKGSDVATVELKPGRASIPIQTPTRKPMTLTVAKGDLLTARGRSYKVLNVVKPQDIPAVGRLVGWIEISAEPVAGPR